MQSSAALGVSLNACLENIALTALIYYNKNKIKNNKKNI